MTRTIRADHTVDSKVYVRVEYETKVNLRQWYRRPNFKESSLYAELVTSEDKDKKAFYDKHIVNASREYEDSRFRYLEALVQGNFTGADSWLASYKEILQSLINDAPALEKELNDDIKGYNRMALAAEKECDRGYEGYRQACELAHQYSEKVTEYETMKSELSAWVAEAKSVMASN